MLFPKTSFPKSEIRVLLLEGISANAEAAFQAAGYTQVTTVSDSLTDDALIELISQAHIVGIRSRTQLNAKVLAHAKRLMAIGCFCIGTNQVDLESAQRMGIPVFNAPYSNTRSVAELVIAHIIFLLRGIAQKNAQCHRGVWQKSALRSHETRGKKLGIIGYGHIGTQVGVLAEALGMQVIFFDIQGKLALGNARAEDSLHALLSQSDVVTLHVPQSPSTFHLIGAAQLAAMKPGAHLINAARGDVVDIDALVTALQSGHVAGAAIDVFPVEPKSNKDPFVSALLPFDQVILTPHIGGSTLEAQDNIGAEVAAKLVLYSDNGSTLSAVNFPDVVLPEHPNSVRILHIHRNVPGIMSDLNEVLSRYKINIHAQYLRTDSALGYVVMDTNADHEQAKSLKTDLEKIPNTIRARLLY